VCFVWISEQTETFALYSINRLVFITETECVYCAVRTESLYKTDTFVSKGLNAFKIRKCLGDNLQIFLNVPLSFMVCKMIKQRWRTCRKCCSMRTFIISDCQLT
jgi:hypothetical protein